MIGVVEGVSALVTGVLDRVWPDKGGEEKERARAALAAELEKFVAEREAARRDVMVEELKQGDPYTKRARPTIVYAGLAFIALVHVLLPVAGWLFALATGRPLEGLPALALPAEFWWAWSGVCGVYAIGRSMEKRA